MTLELDGHSLVVSWETDGNDPYCVFWLIKTGDASHYKVICDGHCLFSELPLVLSSLMSVLDAATRSIGDAPSAGST